MLITVIMTVIKPITAVEAGNTFAIVTGEGKSATLLRGWFVDWVSLTGQVIGSQPHPVRAATHPLEIGHREAEVAAVAIRVRGLIAEVRACRKTKPQSRHLCALLLCDHRLDL